MPAAPGRPKSVLWRYGDAVRLRHLFQEHHEPDDDRLVRRMPAPGVPGLR